MKAISKIIATIVVCFVLVFTGCTTKVSEKSPDKPNIVILFVEDVSPVLGCYGDDYATTPNIDALASEGIIYDFAMTTAPICAPSRSAMVTGLYATSTGTQQLRCEIPFPKELKTLPELMSDAGYFTTNRDKTDYNFDPQGIWNYWSSDYAPWRHRAKGQPFYSFINIGPSHEGSVNNLDSYNKNVKDLAKDEFHDPAKVKLPPYYPDSPKTREVWAHYYDILTVLDKNVKIVIDSLKADGLMDNTIVFFTADHGFGMPRYKRWLNKTGMNVPLIAYVPEKYRSLFPGFRPGMHNKDLLSFIDLPPSILNLAGVAVPGYMEGKPVMGKNAFSERKFAFGARDRADDMYEMSRSVTDGHYIYIRHFMPHLSYIQPGYIFSDVKEAFRELRRLHQLGQTNVEQEKLWHKKPIEELYNLDADPQELTNLATQSEYAGVKNALKTELYKWMVDTKDLGLLPEAEYMMRSAGSTPFDYARNSGDYYPAKILEAAEMVGKASEDEILTKINDSDSGVRYWCVIGLMQFNKLSGKSIGTLNKLLSDPSPAVQVATAEALCMQVNSEEAVKVLGKWVTDERPWLAMQAARSILLVGEAARPLIPQMYKVLEKNLGKPGASLKYKDFNYAAFTSWSLEWALKELGEDIKVN